MLVAVVMQAANDGEAVGHLRQIRQQFADIETGHAGRNRLEGAAIVFGRVRLQIECFQMRRPAIRPEQDDRKVVGPLPPHVLVRQKLREARFQTKPQGSHPQAANGQE